MFMWSSIYNSKPLVNSAWQHPQILLQVKATYKLFLETHTTGFCFPTFSVQTTFIPYFFRKAISFLCNVFETFHFTHFVPFDMSSKLVHYKRGAKCPLNISQNSSGSCSLQQKSKHKEANFFTFRCISPSHLNFIPMCVCALVNLLTQLHVKISHIRF